MKFDISNSLDNLIIVLGLVVRIAEEDHKRGMPDRGAFEITEMVATSYLVGQASGIHAAYKTARLTYECSELEPNGRRVGQFAEISS